MSLLETPQLYLHAKAINARLKLPTTNELIIDAFNIAKVGVGYKLPPDPILETCTRTLLDLIDLEALSEFPTAPSPTLLNSLHGARYRDELRLFIHRFQNPDAFIEEVKQAAIMLLVGFFKSLPPAVFDMHGTGPTVRLLDQVSNLPDTVFALITPFFTSRLNELHLFNDLRIQLEANSKRYALKRKKPDQHFMPEDHDGTPVELIDDFLGDTPLHDLLSAQVPFAIPRKTYASHGIILAPPNHGKTQLLGTIIHGLLNEPDPVGAIALDPHGDLFNTLKDRVDPARLLILDPDTNPPALNFLDFGTSTEAQTLQTFSYLMSSLSGGLSDKQKQIVPYLLKLLRKLENPSIETLAHIVGEGAKSIDKSVYCDAVRALPSTDQLFFDTVWFASGIAETKAAINWRLLGALSSDAFRQMFSAKENSFDADAAIRDRKVVLVKGARTALGDDGMNVFLQFIVSQFFTAALKRESIPAEQRHLCILFADEAHHIFNSQTSNILTECRKYGLGFMGATQVVQQIPDDVKAAIYGATAIKIAGPVSHSDAQVLAREMYTTGDFIRSMKAVERSHADFAFYVTGLTDRAIRVTIPYGTLDNAPVTAASPQTPTARTLQATELPLRDAHEAAPASAAPKKAPRPTEAAPEFELKPGKEW